MGGLRIELENPHRSYFAGQIVEGRVVIQNAQQDKAKEITFSLEGSGRVHWKDKETYTEYSFPYANRRRRRLVTNAAEETYILSKISLVGDGRHSTTIPEGTTSYPFRFILPKNLPSSFTSKIGQVAYILKAEVKRSLLRFNDKARLPFTVNGLVDLNLESLGSQPQLCQKRKGPNWCAFRMGHLNLALSIPRSGFVPGEWIDFRAEIINTSNVKVTKLKAQLQQVTTYYANGKSKSLGVFVSDTRGRAGDGDGDFEVWESNVRVPAVPPTGLGGRCRLIDIRYCLHLSIRLSGLSDPLTGILPVMIGTIPLRDTFVNFRHSPYLLPRILRPQTQLQPQPISNLDPSEIDQTSVAGPAEMEPETGSHGISNVPEMYLNPPPSYLDVARSPSSPLMAEYPDLPPPSYAEAVGSEGFPWETMDNNRSQDQLYQNDHNTNLDHSPRSVRFVPNYVTYNRRGGN